MHIAALFDGDGDLLDDFEAEAFEGGDVHGGVGEEADALDAEVGNAEKLGEWCSALTLFEIGTVLKVAF